MVCNFFVRPFVSQSFAEFWRSWNPFVTYWLCLYCYRPIRRLLPRSLAILLTFGVSGFLVHDLAKTALVLRNIPGLGNIAGAMGFVDFTAPIGNVAALGLRFNGSAFTSIPTSDR
jgi:hypothetical protein